MFSQLIKAFKEVRIESLEFKLKQLSARHDKLVKLYDATEYKEYTEVYLRHLSAEIEDLYIQINKTVAELDHLSK